MVSPLRPANRAVRVGLPLLDSGVVDQFLLLLLVALPALGLVPPLPVQVLLVVLAVRHADLAVAPVLGRVGPRTVRLGLLCPLLLEPLGVLVLLGPPGAGLLPRLLLGRTGILLAGVPRPLLVEHLLGLLVWLSLLVGLLLVGVSVLCAGSLLSLLAPPSLAPVGLVTLLQVLSPLLLSLLRVPPLALLVWLPVPELSPVVLALLAGEVPPLLWTASLLFRSLLVLVAVLLVAVGGLLVALGVL